MALVRAALPDRLPPLPCRTMICTRCGTVQKNDRALPGSGWIELVLWLAAVVPGVIYSIWRRSSLTPGRCTSCGSRDLVELTSPVGRKLAEQHYPGPPPRALRPLMAPAPAPRSLLHDAVRGLGVLSGCVLVVIGGLILFA